jgi:hypothetical protein
VPARAASAAALPKWQAVVHDSSIKASHIAEATMKFLAIYILAAGALLYPREAPQKTVEPPTPCCTLVEEAMKDFGRLRMGTTRKDVEKYFAAEGGVQSRTSTRYAYRKCPYIHVTVDFDAKGGRSATNSFSPTDTVATKSNLFIGYPVTE